MEECGNAEFMQCEICHQAQNSAIRTMINEELILFATLLFQLKFDKCNIKDLRLLFQRLFEAQLTKLQQFHIKDICRLQAVIYSALTSGNIKKNVMRGTMNVINELIIKYKLGLYNPKNQDGIEAKVESLENLCETALSKIQK